MGNKVYRDYEFQGDAGITGVDYVSIDTDATGATEAVRYGQLTKEIGMCEFLTVEELIIRNGLVFFKVPASMDGDKVTGYLIGVDTVGDPFDYTVNIGGSSDSNTHPTTTAYQEKTFAVTLATGDKISIDVDAIPVSSIPKGLVLVIKTKKVI